MENIRYKNVEVVWNYHMGFNDPEPFIRMVAILPAMTAEESAAHREQMVNDLYDDDSIFYIFDHDEPLLGEQTEFTVTKVLEEWI